MHSFRALPAMPVRLCCIRAAAVIALDAQVTILEACTKVFLVVPQVSATSSSAIRVWKVSLAEGGVQAPKQVPKVSLGEYD